MVVPKKGATSLSSPVDLHGLQMPVNHPVPVPDCTVIIRSMLFPRGNKFIFTWYIHLQIYLSLRISQCRQCILAIVTPLPHPCQITPPTSPNFTSFFSGGNFCLPLVLSRCSWVCGATLWSFASLLGPMPPFIFIFLTLNMPCECISVTTRFYLKIYLS